MESLNKYRIVMNDGDVIVCISPVEIGKFVQDIMSEDQFEDMGDFRWVNDTDDNDVFLRRENINYITSLRSDNGKD
jgi:hypothetical protein